ncbi:MAG TPA: DUF5615 family PIN-like protein [Polyangiaceae bacterium]|nr:DUF5615 family PIN-like protein [Polyangiaceae bacterium]
MSRFAADENFHGAIVRGLVRRSIDVVRVQDVGLRGESDERILQWAVGDVRVVLTHDRATLIGTAYDLIRAGKPMFGVIAAAQSLSIGAAIDDFELIATCTDPEEWRDRVRYLPLA